MFMDVVTDFGRRLHADPGRQARARPGPAPLGAPVLAEHPVDQGRASSTASTTSSSGPRTSGSSTCPARCRSISMGIGTLEVHPIDLLGAYGAIANGGVLDAADDDPQGHRLGRQRRLARPERSRQPKPTEVISPQAAYIITDILAGNTEPQGQPVLGRVGGLRRPDPPAGRLQDRHDERQPRRPRLRLPGAARRTRTLPALAVGVWMGNSNNEPNKDTLSLGSSAPLWSRIMRDVSKGTADRGLAGARPGLVDGDGRRVQRHAARAVHDEDGQGDVHQGHRADATPTTSTAASTIDAATGLLWQDGCVGPEEDGRRARLQPGRGELPATGASTTAAGRSAPRAGRASRGGPEGTRTAYFYGGRLLPVRPDAGAGSSPRPSSARSRRRRRRAVRDPVLPAAVPDRPAAGRQPTPKPGQDAEAVAHDRRRQRL